MTFKSKQQMMYADIMRTQFEHEQAREYAFYLIEQTENDIDQCRELFLDQFPDSGEVFEQCVDEALS